MSETHQDQDYPDNPLLGDEIAEAAEANDAARAETLIRTNQFIVLQQIDLETGQVEMDEDEGFSVVLAEVDDELAVVCFSSRAAADSFMDEVCEELAGGQRLPSVILSGEDLLAGLPDSTGLLFNPTTEQECYFPPSCFEFSDDTSDDDQDDEHTAET